MKHQDPKASLRQRLALWCLAASLASSPLARADEIVPEVGARPRTATAPAAAGSGADGKSFTRNLWEGSFDKAGDATRAAEVELGKHNYNCAAYRESAAPDAEKERLYQQCQAAARQAGGFTQEAGRIRTEQRVFSEVSKASDIAAVGAIGAVAYGQMGKASSGQSDGLLQAAQLQETAGYVSYAAGATDFSLGAYAYLRQKQRLEAMHKVFETQMRNAPPAVKSKLATAAEESKNAAYSHMMYGAGKAAVGAASIYLAKRNREQAANMSSISQSAMLPPAQQQAVASVPLVAGAAPNYQNNSPQFALAQPKGTTGSATHPGGSAGAGASGSAPLELKGISDAARAAYRSNGGGGSGLSGGSGAAPGGAGGAAAATSDDRAPASAEADGNHNEALGDAFELSLSGAGPRYGGGKSSSGDDATGGLGSLLSSALGNSETVAATGINPNQVFREATSDLTGEEQGSMAGVNGGGSTLFQVIKLKYNKMVEVGRVQGPGVVQVRN